ncbi:serine/threonine-protein kinase [Nocardioides plantarum]|uniref:non-specific serine/threonine protein kinase n=1 Tax=Nocardioides plantarum TaxID=29299 RepID=A0ABV5K4D3_9ACTN|nr:serine/threonine-protein kinase [Nocardioides plantarum]
MALPQVGQVFGRYRIDDVIGRGGMGVVLGATDTGLGRRVALKVVAADLGGTDEFRARFEREAATLARLASSHVIAIYDYGTQDDCPYIATQYVAGGDLGALLHDRGPMTPADALRVCAQVADALDDAHRVGVVHRDVKPTNVLVRDREADEPHVYLCDFGIARTGTDGLTAVGAVAGTWSYLAPENGRGVPATTSSDLYALGCLLWACLTGHPPYRGTDVAIALAHQRDPVPQLPGDSTLVAAVNEILRRGMAKDPADRYPDAAAFRLALLAAADLPGSGTSLPVVLDDPTVLPHTGVRPPSTPAPSGKPSVPPTWRPPSYPPAQPTPTGPPTGPAGDRRGRGRLVVAAVAALVLLGGGATAFALTRGGDEPDPSPTAGPTDAAPSSGTTDPTGTPSPGADLTGPITGDLDGDGLGDLSFDYDPADGSTLLSTTWRSDRTEFVGEDTVELGPRKGLPTWRLRGDLDDDDTEDVLTFRQPQGKGPTAVTASLSGGGEVDTELDTTGAASGNDALADLDGDGDDDLLHLELVDKRIVLSTRTFDGTTFGPQEERLTLDDDPQYLWVRAGDFDGDDKVDLATLVLSDTPDNGYDGVVDIRLGDGEGGFAEPVSSSVSSASGNLSLLAGDVDASGDDELVVLDADLRLVVLEVFDLTDGTITTDGNAGSVRYINTAPVAFSMSDVNGDRRDDVVAFGLQKTGGTARVQVAVANGATFTSSRWLAWDRRFAARDNADTQRFEILEDARW